MHMNPPVVVVVVEKGANYLFMLTTIKCMGHCKRVNVRKPLVASINFAFRSPLYVLLI